MMAASHARGRGRVVPVLLVLLSLFSGAYGQKKVLTHDLYDSWKSIRSPMLSKDGKWLAYQVAPQVGDGVLIVRATASGAEVKIERGTAANFSHDSKYLLCTVVPPKEEVDKARREKKPAKDQPKNSLAVLELGQSAPKVIERVRSWRLAEKGGSWFAYQIEEVPPTTPAQPAKPAEGQEAAEKPQGPQKKKDHAPGTPLLLQQIGSAKEIRVPDVASYSFSEDGSLLIFAASTKDGKGDGVFYLDLGKEATYPVVTTLGRYSQLTYHDKTRRLAFLSDKDDYGAEKPKQSLFVYRLGEVKEQAVVSATTSGVPQGWEIVTRGALRFSDSGARVQFATAPIAPEAPKDDTPEEEKVQVDVWNWRDPQLQPQQLLQANAERNRSYTAVLHLGSNRVVQLSSPDLRTVNVGGKGDAKFAVAADDRPYLQHISWDQGYYDIYIVNVEDGSRRKALEQWAVVPSTSPSGRFAMVYDEVKRTWSSLELATGKITDLSSAIPYAIHDEEDDHPANPGSYGLSGWTDGDKRVLINDRFDIWACDPTGAAKPTCVTDGVGRAFRISFRPVVMDRERDTLDPAAPLFLLGMNEDTKATGFFRDRVEGVGSPERLLYEDAILTFTTKAEQSDTIVYTRQTFTEYPDLWLATTHFQGGKKVSEANPQQSEYNWGASELVRWVSGEGVPLSGVLVKPENFDPAKKYPMIVYFYERLSDQLHRHRVPAPSASTINPTVYASNGYLVFMPDIPYEIGFPGESSEQAIIPGVLSLIDRGFVDRQRIGIQGQSWGGYQVAFLVTRTNLFRAACAGAPVSNMFSAYGGIRWGSGLVRAMQYEKGQSRIGATIWDKPLLYIENSPVFWADRVNTPLLMMHNDKDGAVPWYQGIEYFTALRRLQKPVWLVVYNNEDHNLTRRPNQKDWAVRMQQFFDHYLKDAPAPKWMTEGVPAVEKGRTLGLEMPGAGKPGG